MKRIRITAFAVLAVLALSAVAVASASAHEFITNKESGILSGKSLTNQVFTTNAGKVTCTGTTSTGTMKGTKIRENVFGYSVLLLKAKYTGCEAFGLSATVSEAEYEFSAEGTVKVDNTITVEPKSKVCHVTVTPTGNSALATIEYADDGTSKIEEKTNLTGVNYSVAVGSVCGTVGSYTNGAYTGSSEVAVEGGVLQYE